MGVLAPGSAHARPSARPPIDTSGNFPAPVSTEWPSAFKTVKIGLFWGVGGVPEFFFIGILLFLLLRSSCKNLEPYDNPFWGFSNGGNNKKRKKKRKEKKKNMENSGLRLSDTVCTAPLGPIPCMLY